MNEIDLSIVIVSYNTKALTANCINSLYRYLPRSIPFEVFVVDNASSDGSREELGKLQEKYSSLNVILSGKNSGFATANNMAISRACGRYTLLFNSDAYLIDDSISNAVRWMDRNPEAFGCGCRLLNRDLSTGISYGHFPELFTMLLEVSTFRLNYRRAIVPREEDEIFPVDCVLGAFYLIRTAFLRDLHGFDETFFMYFEDVDLARRALKRGLKTFYFGKARVVHLGGMSSESNRAFDHPLQFEFFKSWRLYAEKHCTKLGAKLIYVVLATHFLVKYWFAIARYGVSGSAKWKRQCEVLSQGWART
jgi:GT2 family glycosyltransferase